MSGSTNDPRQPGGAPAGPRSTPVAAIAGALVLAGLVGFALYRRAGTPAAPSGDAGATAGAAGSPTPGDSAPGGDASIPQPPPDDPDAPRGAPPPRPTPPAKPPETGTPIVATSPTRLSPEANILAERYRCVCGCNDPLSVCPCRLSRGAEEMRADLKIWAEAHQLPADIDREMVAKYGEAALLSNPAPPQTQPSHAAGAPVKPPSR